MYTTLVGVALAVALFCLGAHVGKHYNTQPVASITMMPIAPPYCEGAVHAPAKEYRI